MNVRFPIGFYIEGMDCCVLSQQKTYILSAFFLQRLYNPARACIYYFISCDCGSRYKFHLSGTVINLHETIGPKKKKSGQSNSPDDQGPDNRGSTE